MLQKLYSENFTGKNAPYSGRKYEIDEIKMMTLPHANFCKRIHEISAVLHFSHLRATKPFDFVPKRKKNGSMHIVNERVSFR